MKKTQKAEKNIRMVERAPSRLKYIVGGIVLVLVSFGVSYFVGTSGSGQINVNATIIEGQKDIPEADRVRTNTRATVPNGGLVPTGANEGVAEPAPEVVEPETETASSTDETTSESDETIEDSADESDEVQSLEELSTELAGEDEPEETTTE